MKSVLLILCCLFPLVASANLYNCNGSGYAIDVGDSPLDFKINGNGLNLVVNNVKATITFDSVFTGNSDNPKATFKLIIKDSSYANPGDIFKGIFSISSGSGVKEFQGLDCVRGRD